MKKSILFTAGIAVIAALFCVTCEDNSGKSPGEDEDAVSFANKFRGGEKPVPPVTDPCAGGVSTACCNAQPNYQGCPTTPTDPCASGVSTACCNAQPSYQGCPTTNPTPTTYTLTVDREPSNGGNTNPASSQSNIQSGTAVNISATPASGYTFNNWTVTSGSATIAAANNQNTTVTLTSDATIRANFQILPQIVYGTPVTYDGETYQTIVIGTQTWFARNLNYNTTDSRCYKDEQSYCNTYGRLYTWEAAKSACPTGWKLPTDDDWTKLVESAGGETTAGKKLKAKSGWNDNGNGTDEYGFTALPGGYGHSTGGFGSADNSGHWWSSTETGARDAWSRTMVSIDENVSRSNINKGVLFSVRCVQN
jgi:uncharacterized protein (TIGR02145 family)